MVENYNAKLTIGGMAVIVEILDDNAGSTLEIDVLFDGKVRDTFFRIWQVFIDHGYVFDKHFKKRHPGDHTISKIRKAESEKIKVEKKSVKKVYPKVTARHKAIWNVIRSIVENGGTYREMRAEWINQQSKKLGGNKKVVSPSDKVLIAVIEKYYKSSS
jgi:hypothetical protein